MGRTVQHSYTFTKRRYWFKLLRKYYYKCNVQVTVNRMTYSGKVSRRFFKVLPKAQGSTYTAVITNVPAQRTAIKAMPVFIKPEKGTNRVLMDIASKIDS